MREEFEGCVLYYVEVSSLFKYHRKVLTACSWCLMWHTAVVTYSKVVDCLLATKAKEDGVSLVVTALSMLTCILIPDFLVLVFQTSPQCSKVGVPLKRVFLLNLYLYRPRVTQYLWKME